MDEEMDKAQDKAQDAANQHSEFMDNICETAWHTFFKDAEDWRAGDKNEIELKQSFMAALKSSHSMGLMHMLVMKNS